MRKSLGDRSVLQLLSERVGVRLLAVIDIYLRTLVLIESGHRLSGFEIPILLRIALPVFENGLVLNALETA